MAEKQGYAKLQDHELFDSIESDLDSRELDEEFLEANPQTCENLCIALSTLQTAFDNAESDRDAWAEEKGEKEEDEEDED